MFEIFKKSILAGLGTAVTTKEKVRSTMQKMVDQGKLTTEEAEQFTKEMVETGEKEMETIRSEIGQGVQRGLSSINLASRTELESLQSRLDNLEKRVDLLTDKAKSSAAQNDSQE